MTDQFRDQMIETARQRAWALLSVAELCDSPITPETIRAAALVPLSGPAARFATNLAHATLSNIEMLALILAGQAREGGIAAIVAEINRLSAPRPRARARRRPRPVAGAVMMGATTPDMQAAANTQLALEPPAAPVELPGSTTVAPDEEQP